MGTSGDNLGARADALWDDGENDRRLLRDGSGANSYGFTKLAQVFHDRIEDVGYFGDDQDSSGFDKSGIFLNTDVHRDFYGGWQFERGYAEGVNFTDVVRDTITCKRVSRASDYTPEGAVPDMERKSQVIIEALMEIVEFYRRFFPDYESRLPSPMYRGVDESSKTCIDQRAYAFCRQGHDAMLMMRDLLMNQLGFRHTDTAEDFMQCLRRVRDDLHMYRSMDDGLTNHEWQLAWDYLQLAMQCSIDEGRYSKLGVHCTDSPDRSDDEVEDILVSRYPATSDFVSDACDYMPSDPSYISSLCNSVYGHKLNDLIYSSPAFKQVREEAARDYVKTCSGGNPLRAKRTLRSPLKGEVIENPTYYQIEEAIRDGRVNGATTEMLDSAVSNATNTHVAAIQRDVSNVFTEVLRKVERLQRRPKDISSTLGTAVKADMVRDINNSLKVLAERCGFDINNLNIDDFCDFLISGIIMTSSRNDTVYDSLLEDYRSVANDDLKTGKIIRTRLMGIPVIMDNIDALTVETARFDIA